MTMPEGAPATLAEAMIADYLGFVQESLAAGALGYVIKPNMVVDLPKAIRNAKADRLFVSVTSAS